MQKVKLPDGAELAYDEYDFTPPWQEADPVVLVHGFTKNRKYWYQWVPQVAQHYRVICPDLRGHGDSTPFGPDFKMGLRLFSDDLARMLDGLGLESAHFVMAEFCSVIALDFAVAHPSRIRSLVIPGFLYIGERIPWPAWEAIVRARGVEGWARETNNVRLPADVDPAMREWYIRQQARMPQQAFLEFCAFCQRPFNVAGNLPKIKAPTLILAGDKAIHESPESVRHAAQTIPNCTLRFFEGMPFNVMSACPERSIAETLAFLGKVTGKG